MKVIQTVSWIAASIVLVVAATLVHDYSSRYNSWRNLSPKMLQQKTLWYLDNRAQDKPSISAICLYIVTCEDDRARLVIAEDLESIDFKSLRSRIWDRRFSETCSGKTSNLGLHLLRDPASDSPNYWYSDHAIWSFYNNRFVPRHGRFSGGSFSEEPWERCSAEKSIYP